MASPRLLGKLVVFAPTWPSWRQSAAGARTFEMVKRGAEVGYEVSCVSPARLAEGAAARYSELGVRALQRSPNDSSATVVTGDEEVAIFDRFYVEEMFGARVESAAPAALRVLDTQDLHFLRESRRRAIESGASLDEVCALDIAIEPTEATCRELAAIHRSDLTLLSSPVELEALVDRFDVPRRKLALAPLFYPPPRASPPFEKRKHVCFIGNFRHSPNLDAVAALRDVVWPRLRPQLPPTAECHVFGASASKAHLDMSSSTFKVVGAVEDQFATLAQYRCLVAPLRFGAGVKGKIADAWSARCAVVTTGIGVEGMTTAGDFAGLWSNDLRRLADLAAAAYLDPDLWARCVDKGRLALAALCDAHDNLDPLFDRFRADRAALLDARRADWTSRILWSQALRATEYKSRYIEANNRFRRLQADVRAWADLDAR